MKFFLAVFAVVLFWQSVSAEECPENEKSTKCFNECGKTCDDFFKTGLMCTEMCNTNRKCTCKPGFVRNKQTDKCVKQEECPNKPVCADNEKFSSCYPMCEGTCDHPRKMCPMICKSPGRCACKVENGKPFVRHGGKCVALDQCPKKNN